MIVNGLTAKEALKLCDLTHAVPASTVYSRVRKAREKGIYNKEIRREQQRKSLLIDVIEVLDGDSRASQDDDVSPLTATTSESSESSMEEDLDDGPSFPSFSINGGVSKKIRKTF